MLWNYAAVGSKYAVVTELGPVIISYSAMTLPV